MTNKRNQIVANVHGVVSAYRSTEFLREMQKYLGKNIGILNGGGNLGRVANAEAPGRVRRGWYEMTLEFEPERDQHLGAYTERECPFHIVAKTTARNTVRMQKLVDSLPPPINYGGYLNGVEMKTN